MSGDDGQGIVRARLFSGGRIVHYAETGSTNADAMARAEGGERGPLWVVADRQIQGRGRNGRVWVSAPGNLLATFLFETAAGVREAVQLSFLAGLAVADTVADVLGDERERIALKWPNDVLVSGAKIAGVLVETTRIKPDGPLVAMIGIGLNVAQAPGDIDQPVTSLADLLPSQDAVPSRDDVLVALDLALARWLARWAHGAGWEQVREAWAERNGLAGRKVCVEMGGALRHGVMRGLSESGALVVDLGDGECLEVAHGDVWLTS